MQYGLLHLQKFEVVLKRIAERECIVGTRSFLFHTVVYSGSTFDFGARFLVALPATLVQALLGGWLFLSWHHHIPGIS